jgi:ribose-phosphate pyrophosphokinase
MEHLVFATEPYDYLCREICSRPGFIKGELERKTFPDGERYLRIKSNVYGRNVVVLGGTINDSTTLEIYDLASGLIAQGADNISILIPYFGYSTQEREVLRGDVVTAKSRATLLSSIPKARLSTEIVLLDLHTPGIAQYFDPNIHSVHLSAHTIHLDLIKKVKAKGDTIIGCTDAGRAKWVQELANEAGVHAAFVYKMRKPDGSTEVTGINADVNKKNLILYDDMVRSGSSLINAGAAYRAAGAASVTAVVTHGVLPADALQKLQSCGHFDQLHCSNSHPSAVAQGSSAFIQVHSIAGLFTEYLSRRSGTHRKTP